MFPNSPFLPASRRRPILAPVFFLLPLLLLAACANENEAPPAARDSAAAPASTWFPLTVGERELSVQLAVTMGEMRRGLMHRKSLDENEGMIFIYDSPRTLSFWMKNTSIPLDIGFFTADGILREVHPLYPFDLESTRSRRDDLQLALETNRDWFRNNNVKPGSRIDLDGLHAALRARGFDPAEYRLGSP